MSASWKKIKKRKTTKIMVSIFQVCKFFISIFYTRINPFDSPTSPSTMCPFMPSIFVYYICLKQWYVSSKTPIIYTNVNPFSCLFFMFFFSRMLFYVLHIIGWLVNGRLCLSSIRIVECNLSWFNHYGIYNNVPRK